MAFLNRCCRACNTGSTVPRWQNVTLVRPVGDSGGTHYTSAPYVRFAPAQYDSDNAPATCATASPGTCGTWLAGPGDLLAPSAQAIQDTVNDIMACASPDTDHVTSDHNCYSWDGTTMVNMQVPKLFGGQWVLAKKSWHGIAGIQDRDDPAWITAVSFDTTTAEWTFTYANSGGTWPSPYQQKFLTYEIDVTGQEVVPSGPYAGTYNMSGYGKSSVARYTGIQTYSGSYSHDTAPPADGLMNNPATAETYFGMGLADWNEIVGGFAFFARGDTNPFGTNTYVQVSATEWQLWQDVGFGLNLSEDITLSLGDGSGSASRTLYDINSHGTVIEQSETATWSNTSYNYSITMVGLQDAPTGDTSFTFTVATSLGDAYTAGECYGDYLDLLAAWNLSDVNLAALRTDEELANAPLIIYDEIGPVTPNPIFGPTIVTTSSAGPSTPPAYATPVMPDYNAGLAYDGNGNAPGSSGYSTTWCQTLLLDPANYVWEYPNGSVMGAPSGFTGGARLLTPMYGGSIIAHNQAGSDRHFWFNYGHFERLGFDPGDGSTRYEWFFDQTGGLSDGNLPPVTLRWMDNAAAQYDAMAYRGSGATVAPPGNYPMAWYSHGGGVLRGGKYLCATQQWPGTNFGRPCGPDKYAIDQPSVCCVMSGDASTGWTVQVTDPVDGNGAAPGATGGLQIGDYMAVGGDGIYKVGAIASTSPSMEGYSQWLISPDLTVGGTNGILDTLPAGFVMSWAGTTGSYLGRLRFSSAPGICGRVAVTTSYTSGVLTLTASIAQPWLRLDPATGGISVDLYDSAMTSGAAITSVSLTRVSDTQWTATMGSAPAITVAYMVAHGVDWTKYSSASRKFGGYINWSFDHRAAQTGYPSPPTWYAGQTGCVSAAIEQFSYAGGACPALVGIVPYYGDDNEPIETGPTGSQFFQYPSAGGITLDETYGTHWQGAIELTMPDPFYQAPFKPDCNNASVAVWSEDDGTGQDDDTDSTPQVWFFAHHPLVEAMANVPSGDSLPGGVSLLYDGSTAIAPPYYIFAPEATGSLSGGIPIGDTSGDYGSVETDWGFALKACATIGGGGRFGGVYSAFVSC